MSVTASRFCGTESAPIPQRADAVEQLARASLRETSMLVRSVGRILNQLVNSPHEHRELCSLFIDTSLAMFVKVDWLTLVRQECRHVVDCNRKRVVFVSQLNGLAICSSGGFTDSGIAYQCNETVSVASGKSSFR